MKEIFNHRIGRTDFYLAVMLHGLLIFGVGWLTVNSFEDIQFTFGFGSLILVMLSVVLAILEIFVFVSLVSLLVRRLHDMSVSGWFSILAFIPIVNFFFIAYLLFFPGTKGENIYGKDRSNYPFLSVVFSSLVKNAKNQSEISDAQPTKVSKKRQVLAIVVLILHIIFLVILI